MAFCIVENLTFLVFMSLEFAVYFGATEDVMITPTCEFTDWALDANCRNRGLDYIPSEYSSAVSMDMRNNQLYILEAEDFSGFSDLRYLDLEFNDIADIHRGAFHGCDSLLYIYLQFNSLESVEEGAYEGASSLERLFLNQNSITQFHRDAFRGLRVLTGLYIGHNEVSQLPPGLFRHTPLLKYLHMGDNVVNELSPTIFDGLTDLTYLNIMNNNLGIIESGTFDPLNSLEELDLSGNFLVSINTFPTFPELKILDLYDNEIQEIGSLPQTVDGLDELYLGQNNIPCTCSMNPIREWIRNHKSDKVVDASKANLTCPSPPQLEGKVLDSISREELCQRASTWTMSTATARHNEVELQSSFKSSIMPRTSPTGRSPNKDTPREPLSTSNPRSPVASGKRQDIHVHKPRTPHQTLRPRTSATSRRHNEDRSHDDLHTLNPRKYVTSPNNAIDDYFELPQRYRFLGLDDAIVYVIVSGITVSVVALTMCVIIRCLVWRTQRYHQQLQAAAMKRQKMNHTTALGNSSRRDENEDPYSYIPAQPPTYYDSTFGSHSDKVNPGTWNAYPHHTDNFATCESRLLEFTPLPPSSPIPALAREQLYRDPSLKDAQDSYQAATVPEEYNGSLDVTYPAPVLPGYDHQDPGTQGDQCQIPYESPRDTPQHSPGQIKHEYFTHFRVPPQYQQV